MRRVASIRRDIYLLESKGQLPTQIKTGLMLKASRIQAAF